MFGSWLAEAPAPAPSEDPAEDPATVKTSAKIADDPDHAPLIERARKQSASMDVDFSAASYSGVDADRRLRAKPMGFFSRLRERLFGHAPPPRAMTTSG